MAGAADGGGDLPLGLGPADTAGLGRRGDLDAALPPGRPRCF